MVVVAGGGGGGAFGRWVVKIQAFTNFRNFGLPGTTFRAFSWWRKRM